MRKILAHSKSITPKALWKRGYAMLDLNMALTCKRPAFKHMNESSTPELKQYISAKIAQGVTFAVIYRKQRFNRNIVKSIVAGFVSEFTKTGAELAHMDPSHIIDAVRAAVNANNKMDAKAAKLPEVKFSSKQVRAKVKAKAKARKGKGKKEIKPLTIVGEPITPEAVEQARVAAVLTANNRVTEDA